MKITEGTPAWLAQALSNPDVTDLCLNGSQSAFLDQGRGLERIEIGSDLNDHKLRDWIIGQLGLAGKTWDAKHPFVDCTLPSGHRLHVAFPPLTRQGILISLRRLPNSNNNLQMDGLDNDQKWRTLPRGPHRWKDSALFAPLAEAVRRGDSVLISGSTGSGKTTLISGRHPRISPPPSPFLDPFEPPSEFRWLRGGDSTDPPETDLKNAARPHYLRRMQRK